MEILKWTSHNGIRTRIRILGYGLPRFETSLKLVRFLSPAYQMKAMGLNFTLSMFLGEFSTSVTMCEIDFDRPISSFSSEKSRSYTHCFTAKTSFYMLLVVCFHFLWIFGGFSPTELVRKATGLVWHRFLQNLGSKKRFSNRDRPRFRPVNLGYGRNKIPKIMGTESMDDSPHFEPPSSCIR